MIGVSRIDEFKDDIDSIVEGYSTYLTLLKQVKSSTETSVSSESAYKRYIVITDSEESKSFQNLYEFVNIRTYSKAIWETIGSMMSIAVSNGHNLSTFNLDKELYIRFNVPPLLKLQDFVKFIAKSCREIGDKEFYIKNRRLNLTNLSCSLANFRSKQEELSHFLEKKVIDPTLPWSGWMYLLSAVSLQ